MAVRQSGRTAIRAVQPRGTDARQFRNVNDAGEFIDMHSPQGRTMVKQMQDTEWGVFAVDSGGQTDSAT